MRLLIFLLTYSFALLLSFPARAQNYSIYNSYFLNPSFYNPAEVATDFTYVHLNYRQQWYGFQGAPKTLTASFTTLINETRTGIGAKISSYSRGILNTTDLSLSYAHGILLGPKNTFLFGLSGGGITNNIDVSQVDISDPALSNYATNNIQPAATAGILFRSESGLNFGVALPQLFTSKFNASSDFLLNTFSPVDNVIFSGYYKRKIEGKLVNRKKRGVRAKVKTKESIAPLEFYGLYRYSKTGTSQAEGTVKINLSQNLWVAGLFRQSYGFGASIGFAFNNMMLNYSYEPGSQPSPKFSSGSHEIHLAIRLGEQKKFRRVAPTLRSTMRGAGGDQHIARFQKSDEEADNVSAEKHEKKQYYIVVKAFNDFSLADEFKKKLIKEKYNANVFYYEKDKKYYVYVFESSRQGEAHDEARNLKLYTKLKDVRVLTVIVPKD